MDSEYQINSKEYWNWRYKNNWDFHHGSEQTAYFANILISNILESILDKSESFLDFGCGKGQLCNLLKSKFPDKSVSGYDISEEALQQASSLFPNCSFTTNLPRSVDTIVSSNTFEHLSNWQEYLTNFTQIAQKNIIILVPYKSGVFDEHVVSFDVESFPRQINDFKIIHYKIIQCNEPLLWSDKQLVVTYKRI